MRKTLLFAAALCAATAASAQTGEITSNRGENWLSQDGDWGLTFDAQPLLTYAGNLFNNGSNYTGTAQLTWYDNYNAITLKKLVDANTAYRGKVRIGFGSTKITDLVPDSVSTYTPPPINTVENVTKDSYMTVVLGAGLEKRVGSTRVVGVYGAEAYIMFGNSKTKYEWGNALGSNYTQGGAARPTEAKHGSMFGIGVGIFGGIEWFFAPKMSLSGEYEWGVMLSSSGLASTSYEYWDASANNGAGAVSTFDQDQNYMGGTQDKRSDFSIDTGVSGASIGINFYFQ